MAIDFPRHWPARLGGAPVRCSSATSKTGNGFGWSFDSSSRFDDDVPEVDCTRTASFSRRVKEEAALLFES